MSENYVIDIANFKIGLGRVFIIAEIGNNHNGSLDLAIQLVDQAVEIGVDCVKFQMRDLKEVYRDRSLSGDSEDLGTEYIVDLLKRFELTADQHEKLSAYCKEKGILYLCTPWDVKSVDCLERLNVPAYKVASADLTNLPLLHKLSLTNKPLILSTGMSHKDEIQATVDFLNKRSARFIMLHCNSTYPAPFRDINLNWMGELKKIHPLIGYSGHERGIAVSLATVAMGASLIERHFTLDRGMEGPDHAASLEYAQFNELVEGVRQIEMAMGSGVVRQVSQGEMINRENLSKSLVASRALKKGEKISQEDILVRSPGQGLSPQNYDRLLGCTLQRDVGSQDFFYESDLLGGRVEPRSYNFSRPWGVPVRYHDFKTYSDRISPNHFEFHFSYSDLDLPLHDYLQGEYPCKFMVHAPELLSNSRLMDLASPDENYRKYSIIETQKVIDKTRELRKFFPKTERPMIILNIGGFSMDKPLPKAILPEYYARFGKSLKELDGDGVELIPQTMAPFPWHFGGQRYQNLFVHEDEIIEWCDILKLRMCFDISHTQLTCNHFGFDFYDFAKNIAPITAHLHIGDALGVNGEGLQIGTGNIDFCLLGKVLKLGCPNASFIPEIWQGHKNSGEGFWIALDRLEGFL